MTSSRTRPPLDQLLLSIVLPVYNERCVLVQLLAAVTAAVETLGVRHEIVFVNDGSHDGSDGLLDELARSDSRVRVIHFSRNFGHQAAVHAGLSFARGDAVVLMDSDLQDAPSAIGRFLQRWQARYDVVYAIRTKRKEHAVKRFLFHAFHRLLSRLATTAIPADAGNFSLIDRRVVRELVSLAERDRYLPGLRSWVGYRQIGVEVERLPRYDNEPRVSLWGLWRLAKTAIFSFSACPLAVFYLIGYVALGIFTAVAGYSLFCRLFTNLAIPGWTSHILSACFFGALNALGISILGEYVIRIYDQVRGRPLFLVDRTMNVANDDERSSPADVLAAETASQAVTAPNDNYDQLLEQVSGLLEVVGQHRQAAELPAPSDAASPYSVTICSIEPISVGSGSSAGQRISSDTQLL